MKFWHTLQVTGCFLIKVIKKYFCISHCESPCRHKCETLHTAGVSSEVITAPLHSTGGQDDEPVPPEPWHSPALPLHHLCLHIAIRVTTWHIGIQTVLHPFPVLLILLLLLPQLVPAGGGDVGQEGGGAVPHSDLCVSLWEALHTAGVSCLVIVRPC